MELKLEEAKQESAVVDVFSNSSSSSISSVAQTTPERNLEVEMTYRGMKLVYDKVLMIIRSDYDQSPDRRLYIVPESLKRNVMELYHDSKGHPGAARTKETIYLTYWWKGMSADVECHVKSCKSCARRKARNAVAAIPIQGYHAPTMPWERVHIDLTGPLTTTTLGNRYIVVIKDALTRYVETVAIKDKSAELVVDAFIQCVIYRHGSIGTLVSDNGREFVNKLFAQVAQLLRIKHHTITEYNPRANGLAENHMRTMKDSLSIYCDESQKDWDIHLNGVSAAYNTTINSQTGFTPFFMLYGREARLPSEKWLRSFAQTTGVLPYITNVVKALSNVWDASAANKPVELQRMREGQKPIRHLQFAEYKVGEYAMIVNTPKSQNIGWVDAKFRKLNLKLQPRYSGPYLIIRRLSPVVYVLQIDGFDTNVHATNMKPFVGRKTATTPYAEPGFNIYQANERVTSEPLLLSPDANLNEKARLRYRKKSVARSKDHSETINARQSRELRETEMRERLSASQDSLVIGDDLMLRSLKETNPRSQSSSRTDDRTRIENEEETNQIDVSNENEPTTPDWEVEFKRRRIKGFHSWKEKTNGKHILSRGQEKPTIQFKHQISSIEAPKSGWINRQRRVRALSYDSPGTGMTHSSNVLISRQEEEHPRKKPKGTLRQQVAQRKSNLTKQQVEECNLAGGERWEQPVGNASVDLRDEDDSPESEISVVGSISSEDSFNREQWHRTVLKACTNHASKLSFSTIEPIIFGFDNKPPHKLRVELDMGIQIPIEYRELWYRLHLEIRHFGKTGLLFPTQNPMLENQDHWRNNSRNHIRHTPLNIYLRLLSIPTSVVRTLFHPRCKGKITLSTDPGQNQIKPGHTADIQRKYDQWYWNAMRTARRMDVDPSSPRRAYSKLRGHSRQEGMAMNGPAWRAHHYFMWDAIQRNQSLREPPIWFMEQTLRC